MEIKKYICVAGLAFLFGCTSNQIVGDNESSKINQEMDKKDKPQASQDRQNNLRNLTERMFKCTELATALYISKKSDNQSLKGAIAHNNAVCGLKDPSKTSQLINQRVVEKGTTAIYNSLTKLGEINGETYSFEMCLEVDYTASKIEGMEELCGIDQNLSKRFKEKSYKINFCKEPLITDLQTKLRVISRSELEDDMKEQGKQKACVNYREIYAYLSTMY